MNKKLIVVSIVLILSSCVTLATVRYEFNEVEAKKLLAKGNNTIRGSALIRHGVGGVITCAGNIVSLTPATKYGQERMKLIYGNVNTGYVHSDSAYKVKFTNNSEKYLKLTKETKCDTQGYFVFNNIADGAFFITTYISWIVPPDWLGRRNKGATLMKKINVKGGGTTNIVLSPQTISQSKR